MLDDAVLMQGRHTKRKYKWIILAAAAFVALTAAWLGAHPGTIQSLVRRTRAGLLPNTEHYIDMPEGTTACAPTETRIICAGSGFLRVLDRSGREMLQSDTELVSPLIRTAGDWAVVYEPGGVQFYLTGKSGITAVELLSGVDAAAVSSRGDAAVITAGSGYLTELRRYDADGVLLSRTGFTDRAVGRITFLSDGTLAHCGVSPEGVWFLTIGGQDIPLASRLVYDLKPCGSGAAVLTSEGLEFYDLSGEQTGAFLPDAPVLDWDCGEYAAAVFWGQGRYRLAAVSPDGVAQETALSQRPRAVTVCAGCTAVLDRQALWIYDAGGALLERSSRFQSADDMTAGPFGPALTEDGTILLHKIS